MTRRKILPRRDAREVLPEMTLRKLDKVLTDVNDACTRCFHQVIDFVSSDATHHGGVVEWPPSTEVLEAAGGVGFGTILQTGDVNLSRIMAEDVMVPPVIRFSHPKLAADAYVRHRRDPLFLYKVSAHIKSIYITLVMRHNLKHPVYQEGLKDLDRGREEIKRGERGRER